MKKIMQFSLTTLTIVISQMPFTSSPLAVTYDLLEEQREAAFDSAKDFDTMTTPGWDSVSPDEFIVQEKEK